MENNEKIAKYYLGKLINQDGYSYATVYNSKMPQALKNRLLAAYNTKNDIWDQLFFCTKEQFDVHKYNGWAK